jgi:chorismate mutase
VHFLGGHPLAGAERSGIAAADHRLFRGTPWVLCPETDTPEAAWLGMLDLLEEVGALPVAMGAGEHDELLAATSHVPQLVALALVHAATSLDASHGLLGLVAGPTFREMTRVAASPWEVWQGILATNRVAVLAALERLETSLATLRRAMEADDLGQLWHDVAAARGSLPGGGPAPRRQADLRAVVDRCDARLLATLGERFRAVEAIGALKQATGRAVLDSAREARLLERWRQWGSQEGVPETLLEPLFASVVSTSRRVQITATDEPATTSGATTC